MKHLEAKSAEDGRSWYLDIETVLVIDQSQVLDFVDNETLKAVMENGELGTISALFHRVEEMVFTHCLQPQRRFRYCLTVEQQAGKEQAKKHHQTPN